MIMGWQSYQCGSSAEGWAAGDVRVLIIPSGPRPVVWRLALHTTDPAGGTWRIWCGAGTAVPIELTPAVNGSDLIDVPGLGLTVEWAAVTPAGAGDRVRAAAAPWASSPAEWDQA